MLVEVRAAPLDAALRVLDAWSPALYGTALHIALESEAAISRLRAALDAAGLGDATITLIAPSLEDVFLALVTRQPAEAA